MDAHGDEHTIETPLWHYGDGVAAVVVQCDKFVGTYVECLRYILYVALSTRRYACVARTTGVGRQ